MSGYASSYRSDSAALLASFASDLATQTTAVGIRSCSARTATSGAGFGCLDSFSE